MRAPRSETLFRVGSLGEGGRLLLQDTFDTPEALTSVLLISRPTT